MKPGLRAGLLFSIAALASCAPPAPPAPPAPRALSVTELESPAPLGSAQPDLAVDSQGRMLLSWIEPAPEGSRSLHVARREATAWSALGVPHEGGDILANWADTPRLAVDGSRLALSWPRLQGEGSEGYDVVVQLSSDEGATWSLPVTPHRDGTATEHDFPSLHADPAGGLGIVWLDGRAHSAGAAAQALMTATIGPDGLLGPERILDPRVCDCCATASIRSGETVIVAYRDRSEAEVRDISIVRQVGDRWTEPVTVAPDGWTLTGCPVNGPALAAGGPGGSRVVLAWFTSPESGPRVNVAFSEDGGATFGAATTIDDGAPLGRVDVALLSDGNALVAWVEGTATTLASLRVRVVTPAGKILASASVADVEAARSGGFPRLAAASDGDGDGDDIVAAWTSRDGDATRVKLALLRWK